MNFLFTNELNALVYLPCTIYPIIYQPLSNFLWEKQYKQYKQYIFTSKLSIPIEAKELSLRNWTLFHLVHSNIAFFFQI